MKYIFRGITVIEYDPKTKQMTIPNDENERFGNFNHCKFIPDDYVRLSGFFAIAALHAEGKRSDEQLFDTVVN